MTKLTNLSRREFIFARHHDFGHFLIIQLTDPIKRVRLGFGTITMGASTRSRSADKLIEIFEARIRDGTIAEGATLPPEREIVQDYGVSRTVAREAVLALAAKGLVEARPGFRPVVKKPSYDTALNIVGSVVPHLLQQSGGVRNLFDVRIMMEASLARTAAVNATREDIQALKDALAHNRDAIDEPETFYATDVAFHGVLYSIPGNPLLPSLHRAYTAWLAPQWSKMPRMATRNEGNYQAHRKIFDAILMRDPDEAERQVRSHLSSAWHQVKATFRDL